MKRKPINKHIVEDDAGVVFFRNKLDEALDALTKNEDEISRVFGELLSRDLTPAQRDEIAKRFSIFTKKSKAVRDITGN